MADPTSYEDQARRWFKFHPATEKTGPLHARIRSECGAVAETFIDVLPPGADKTLALRKLQEAMMFANACIANAQTPDEDQRQLNANSTA